MGAIIDIEKISLSKGQHENPKAGACVMELVSYVAGEPWSDHPECACPVLTAFCVGFNDSVSDEVRQRLKPFIPRLVGTRSTPEVELRRSMMAMDWIIRTYTPAWLDLVDGLKPHAEKLRALPGIIDTATLLAAQPTIDAARKSVAAAWAAAGEAAWAAAGEAAWAAAGEAAWAAAGEAAWAAAWEAAREAAGDAAGEAAGEAARAAAWAAAGTKLDQVVMQLQESALGLLDRMIEAK